MSYEAFRDLKQFVEKKGQFRTPDLLARLRELQENVPLEDLTLEQAFFLPYAEQKVSYADARQQAQTVFRNLPDQNIPTIEWYNKHLPGHVEVEAKR